MRYQTLTISDNRMKDIASERAYKNYLWKVRRKRQLRNRIMMFVFSICLIVAIAISCHAITTHAESDIGNLSFKYYTEIEVEYGDTLWSIAQEYKDSHYNSTMQYIKEVISINHLSGDLVKEGQKLIVPYYSDTYVK